MAHKILKPVWVSDDGAEFDNEADALEQDAVAELVAGLIEGGVGRNFMDAELDHLARRLLKMYTMTRKEG